MFDKLKGFFKKEESTAPVNSEHYQKLVEYKNAGITRVETMSWRDGKVCSVCIDADGNKYPITDNLNDMPLPHKNCKNESCRCHYIPLPEE